jgi:hypothetical protein
MRKPVSVSQNGYPAAVHATAAIHTPAGHAAAVIHTPACHPTAAI